MGDPWRHATSQVVRPSPKTERRLHPEPACEACLRVSLGEETPGGKRMRWLTYASFRCVQPRGFNLGSSLRNHWV